MIFSRNAVLLCTAAFLILPVSPAGAETLREAVEAALLNHPSIDAAEAGRKRVNEERREKVSDFYPEVNASATGGRMFGDNATSRGLTVSRGAAYSWLWEGSASVTQPLFDGFETFNRVDAAEARTDSAAYGVTDAQETIALRAVQSYINLMRAQEALAKISNYRMTIQSYLERIEMMVNEGAADEAEAAQARNISLLLDDSLASFEGQVETALADYREVVGTVPAGELKNENVPDSLLASEVEQAVEYSKRRHPLILAALKDIEAASHDIDAEQGTLLPDLNGEISYLKKDQKEEIGGEMVDQRAVLRMNWTFATGGGDFARIRKSKAAYAEEMARKDETERQVERDVRSAYAELQTARKQKELVTSREEITKGLFNTYETQFEGARVSLLQLMQAENQYVNTQLDRINADYRHMLAEYTVLASTGQLIETLKTPFAEAEAIAEMPELKPEPIVSVEDYPPGEEKIVPDLAK